MTGFRNNEYSEALQFLLDSVTLRFYQRDANQAKNIFNKNLRQIGSGVP